MSKPLATDGARLILCPVVTVAAAAANVVQATFTNLAGMKSLTLEALFLYGAGGTAVKAWIQTSLDGGTTWFDIVNFAFATSALNKIASVNSYLAATHATPSVVALSDNSVANGLLGDQLRCITTSTGTYTGLTSLAIYAVVKA